MADEREREVRITAEPASSSPAELAAGHALPGASESTDPVVVTGRSARISMDGRPDPDDTREEIARTRVRMSETIDQIEEQLLRKKEQLQDRLDVKGQLRERLAPANDVVQRRPLAVAGGVFAFGLVLGLLTGGHDDDFDGWEDEMPSERRRGSRARARRWENRSRELLRRNQLLEAELRELRDRLDRSLGDDDAGGGWFSGLFGRGRTRTEVVLEVEAEDDMPGEYHPAAPYQPYSQTYRRDPEDPLQG